MTAHRGFMSRETNRFPVMLISKVAEKQDMYTSIIVIYASSFHLIQ